MTKNADKEVVEAIHDLVRRADTLLNQVRQLSKAVAERHPGKSPSLVVPGLQAFDRGLVAERSGLQNLLGSARDQTCMARMRAVMAAANIPHYEARWAVVKRRRHLVAMVRTFSRHDKWTAPTIEKPNTKGMTWGQAKDAIRNHRTKNRAECDAVVERGAEWIKVSAASHKSWIHKVVEAGIFFDSDNGGDGCAEGEEECEDDVPIVHMVRRLVQASRANPYGLRKYPRIRVVLLRIKEGRAREIDWVIQKLRKLGDEDVRVIVDCANGEFVNSPVPAIEEAVENLLLDPERETTTIPSFMCRTLNLDCSVLLGYISDITNSRCEIQPWHKPDIRHYITLENSDDAEKFVPLMNGILAGHELVCTRHILEKFRQITKTIGTETERMRYRLVMPAEELDDEDRTRLPPRAAENVASAERVAELRKLSIWEVPENLQLPLRVVEGTWDLPRVEALASGGSLPTYAVPVVKGMGSATVSPLVYGWHARCTTVTSCLSFVDRFLSLVQLYGREPRGLDPAEAAPSVIRVSNFRSLLALRRPSDIPAPPRRVKPGGHWRGLRIVPPAIAREGGELVEKAGHAKAKGNMRENGSV